MLSHNTPTRSYIIDPQLQMQEHHPRFLYHDANWLIRHMAISHLSSLNRKFRKLGVDPDISVYQQYLEKKALKPTTQRRTEMRGPMPHGIYKVCQPLFILSDMRHFSHCTRCLCLRCQPGRRPITQHSYHPATGNFLQHGFRMSVATQQACRRSQVHTRLVCQ